MKWSRWWVSCWLCRVSALWQPPQVRAERLICIIIYFCYSLALFKHKVAHKILDWPFRGNKEIWWCKRSIEELHWVPYISVAHKNVTIQVTSLYKLIYLLFERKIVRFILYFAYNTLPSALKLTLKQVELIKNIQTYPNSRNILRRSWLFVRYGSLVASRA